MPDETDPKKISTASPWKTGGDHQDTHTLIPYYVDEDYAAGPEVQ